MADKVITNDVDISVIQDVAFVGLCFGHMDEDVNFFLFSLTPGIQYLSIVFYLFFLSDELELFQPF